MRFASASVIVLVVALVAAGVTPAASNADSAAAFVVGFDGALPLVGESFLGARVVRVNDAARFFTVETPHGAHFAATAAAAPFVRFVEPDVIDVTLAFTPNDPQYNIQDWPAQVRAPQAWDTTLGDTDARICALDTGLHKTHVEFAGPRLVAEYDFSAEDNDATDTTGHGTHVLGVAAAAINNGENIAGMGNVGFLVGRISGSGSITASRLADAVTWCADTGGPRTVLLMPLTASFSHAVTDALTYAAVTKGLPVVASVGNGGNCSFCVAFPANLTTTIAVGCTTWETELCDFSNAGPEVDIVAPGKDIISTWIGSNTNTEVSDGTSLSAGLVAGALALYWSHDTAIAGPALKDRLLNAAQDLGATHRDRTFGCGELDVLNLFNGAGTCTDPPPPVCDDTPPNDCFRNAREYDAGFARIVQSTSDAVMEPGEPSPCAGLGASVWFRFTASKAGPARVTTEGSFFDTALAVYEGSSLTSLTSLGCNDNAHPGTQTSSVLFTCRLGVTYYVQAGGRDAREGGLQFNHEGCQGTTPPSPPVNPAAAAGPNRGAITVTWQAPSDNGNATVTGYKVYGGTPSLGPPQLIATLGSTASSFVDSGLGDGVTREYYVTARNSAGDSDASATVTARTFSTPTPPRNVRADSGFPPFSIEVDWSPPSDTGGQLQGYDLYRATSPNGPFVLRFSMNAASSSFRDGPVDPDQAYYYKVRARNVVGVSGDSNVACGTAVFLWPSFLDPCR